MALSTQIVPRDQRLIKPNNQCNNSKTQKSSQPGVCWQNIFDSRQESLWRDYSRQQLGCSINKQQLQKPR